MVVEDDASLREIYSIRITADGYDVVSAGDGEEALAVAVREKPDLILSDVMMPKISGFDMLDILRSTPETANIKVIMMTALSSDDQRARGERLGANRYLVKPQVGIEDVVNAIHEVLGDRHATPQSPVAQPMTQPATPPTAQPAVQPAPQPTTQPAPQPIPQQPQTTYGPAQ
jgi:DNA-binding response OmpR family regulator